MPAKGKKTSLEVKITLGKKNLMLVYSWDEKTKEEIFDNLQIQGQLLCCYIHNALFIFRQNLTV